MTVPQYKILIKLFVTTGLLVVVAFALLISFIKNVPEPQPVGFCGVVYNEPTPKRIQWVDYQDTKWNIEAENLFKTNCSMCHRLDTRDLTGPGLATLTSEQVENFFFDQNLKWESKYPGMDMGPERHRKMYSTLDTATLKKIASLADWTWE